MDGLAKSQRAYDRMESTSLSAIDLSECDIEQHIREFADSDEAAKDFLISRGVSEDGLSYFGDLLRVLAKDYVAGKGCSREFWQIMSRHAYEIAKESRDAADALNAYFGESLAMLRKL